MLAFFFKKNICDGWDNLFSIIVSNVFTLVLGIAAIFATYCAISVSPLLTTLIAIACSGIVMVPIFAWGANARKIADFNTPSLGTFFRTMRVVWKQALAFGMLLAALCTVASFCINFYLAQQTLGLVGLLLAAFVFWFVAISALSLQWFIPFYFLQEDNTFIKCLKKSFIIFFDNPAFSIVVFAHNLALLVLSTVLFFFVPGTSGITLACTNALRLRLYKYDWIENMSKTDPNFAGDRKRHKQVPWAELLKEDRETLGPRTLRSFLFPWK